MSEILRTMPEISYHLPDDAPTVPVEYPDTAESPPSFAEEALSRIREAEAKVGILRSQHEELKEETGAAKKKLDCAIDELCKLIRSETEPHPLFDAAHAATQPPDDLDSDESWRQTPLTDILAGEPQSIHVALEDAGLKLLGELTDWLGDAKHRLTDIPGIGKVKAEKIEQALEAFWQRRREMAELHQAAQQGAESLTEGS